jgi:murein DD-endopeptidase MepM/ murein hydrolase activator NlpD
MASLVREVRAASRSIRRRAGLKTALRWTRYLILGLAATILFLVVVPPFSWPIRGRVSSGFFLRLKPDSPERIALEFHDGLDIAATMGSPVHATAPGIVEATGFDAAAGNFILVRHLFGGSSFYGHLSKINARKGRLVLIPFLGKIGEVGSTGRSTGPHLHFEIKIGSLPLPPRALLVFHTIRRAIIGI